MYTSPPVTRESEQTPARLELPLDSVAATERAGEALGRVVTAGDVIGLVGDLGAGKTLLVKALARGLEVPAAVRVLSPTFTLINEYRGGRLHLVHADLYRIDDPREVDAIGLDDAMRGDVVAAVEWSDRADALPRDHLVVRLDVIGDDARQLCAQAQGPRGRALLQRWRDALAPA